MNSTLEFRFLDRFAAAFEPVFVFRPTGALAYLNLAAERWSGLDASEALEKPGWELLGLGEPEFLASLQSLPLSASLELAPPSGRSKVKIQVSPWMLGNRLSGYCLALPGLSLSPLQTLPLGISVGHLRRVLELSGIGQWEWNLQTGESYWSPELYKMLGESTDNPTPHNQLFLAHLPAEDRPAYLISLQEMVPGPFDLERRLVRVDGSVLQVRIQGEVSCDEQGRPGRNLGLVQDVTNQKRLEALLAKSHQDLEQAQALGHLGSWSWEIETNRFEWSNEFFRLWGYAPQEVEPGIEAFAARLHPQDRDQVLDNSKRSLQDPNFIGDLDHRVLWPNGEVRWIRLTGAVQWEDGKPKRMVGAALDRTLEVQAKQQLEEEQASLSRAQSLAHLGSWDWDLASGGLLWSDELYRILGLEPGSVPPDQEVFFSAIHPEDREGLRANLWRITGEPDFSEDREVRLLRPGGEMRRLHLVVRTAWDGNKAVRAFGTVQDLTELRELQKRYRLLSENLHDLIYRYRLNPPGFEYVSPSSTQLLGYSPEEFYQSPRLAYQLSVEEDYDKISDLLRGRPESFEKPLVLHWRRKDGQQLWIEQYNTPIYDPQGNLEAIAGVARDITERMDYEEQLRQSEARYYQMFESNQAVKLLVDPKDGQIVEANQAAVEFYGYPKDQFLEMKISQINPLPWEQIQKKMAEATQKKSANFLFPHRLASGEIRQVEVFTGPVSVGRKQYLYSIVHDVTDRVQAEARLLAAKGVAEEANRVKGEFLANVSHEIRTPLNAVLGFTELLAETVQQPEAQQYVNSIRTSGVHLLHLINDILDLSKIESGGLQLANEPLAPREVMEEMEQIFRLEFEHKSLGFQCRVDESVPKWLHWDRGKLHQILTNLIGNALKFTESGWVAVTIWAVRNPLDLERVDLGLSVEDTGIGIALDQQEKVFESFRQQEGQSARRFGGTGLGLTIVKRLTEYLGGKLLLSSQPGKGSRFELHFPKVTELKRGEVRQRTPAGAGLGSLAGRRVLVVDDSPINLELLRSALLRQGMKVLEATNGLEALEIAFAEQPAVVLMDLFMPKMDGFEARTRLLKDPRTRAIPVLAVTAAQTSDVLSQVQELGFQGVFYKPLVIHDLLVKVAELLEFSPSAEDREGALEDWPSEPEFWTRLAQGPFARIPAPGGSLDLQELQEIQCQLLNQADTLGVLRLKQEATLLGEGLADFNLVQVRNWLTQMADLKRVHFGPKGNDEKGA